MKYVALEEHILIPELAERHPAGGTQPPFPLRFKADMAEHFSRRLVDVGVRLADMDEAGIDLQVLSLTTPGLEVDIEPAAAVVNARFANERIAAMVAEHPDRFRGFAALPLQDPVAAADELTHAVTELGLCGALVNDCIHGPGGRYLDAPQYDALWSAFEALGVPLYLHPGAPPIDDWQVLNGRPELYGAPWSWAAEVGGHALRLVFGKVFDRHPRATVILGHMGEFLPFQRSRLDSRYLTLDVDEPLDRAPSTYLGTNIRFTNSGVFSPATVLGAVHEVGAAAVMFSVDYPYESAVDAVAGFDQTALSDHDRRLVAHANAERLLRL